MSAGRRRAAAGELLRDLVPDAGHLRHMPTHLDVLCGDYRSVVAGNIAAIVADESSARARRDELLHAVPGAQHHFKVYGAMFLGQQRTALEAAGRLARGDPRGPAPGAGPADGGLARGFVAMRLHVLIRFGRWQDILDRAAARRPGPVLRHHRDDALCEGRRATRPPGQVAEARERARSFAARGRVPRTRTLFNNTCQDILAVAGAMLDGEVEYRRGNYERPSPAAARRRTRRRPPLRRAMGLDAASPARLRRPAARAGPRRRGGGGLPRRPRPGRHAGPGVPAPRQRLELARVPRMPDPAGQAERAGIMDQQLKIAAARADVPIRSSCYCRQS